VSVRPANAQSYNPNFAVDTAANHVHGHGWPGGVPVTLTIDDPSTGASPDYADTQTSVAEGEDTVVRFWPGEVFEIQPGHLVTLSDGSLIKQHTVTSLSVTGFNGYQDRIWGMAKPGTLVVIKLRWDMSIIRYETAGATGNWLADFSIAGDEPGEDKLYDFDVDTWLMVYQEDNDGDRTQIDWRMPFPDFQVRLTQNIIEAHKFPMSYLVTLSIDDPATGAGPDFSTSVDPEPC